MCVRVIAAIDASLKEIFHIINRLDIRGAGLRLVSLWGVVLCDEEVRRLLVVHLDETLTAHYTKPSWERWLTPRQLRYPTAHGIYLIAELAESSTDAYGILYAEPH